MKYFCTLFDCGYLIKGLVMLDSLHKNCPNALVYVLCMDEDTQNLLGKLELPYVRLIPLKEIETIELLEVKKDRGVAEYCWTLSPCFPWYLMQTYRDIDLITYLDADLHFYSSVQPLFDEIADSSVAIIEHRFTPRLMNNLVNGRFCVEWVSFRRDEEGMACLNRWRKQCIEWCYYRLEDGRMGDQKYLDEWPTLYKSCHILQNVGAGVAPWNYAQYSFGKNLAGGLTVNNLPMVFYHFHQFQLLKNGKFDRLSSFYTSEVPEPELIYLEYEKALIYQLSKVRKLSPGFDRGLRASASISLRRLIQRYLPANIKNILRAIIRL
jgi:hypothetical protein